MTGISISSLISATTPLTGAELVPVVQSGTTAKTTLNAMPYVPAGTGAVTTTIQSKLRETVSVKDFGAVGDGVVDDTAAIQAAIDYAQDNGKSMYLPGNTYKTSSTLNITKRIHIFGDGMWQSQIIYTGASSAIQVSPPTNGTSNTGYYFNDFGISPAVAGNGIYGINFYLATNAYLSNWEISRIYIGDFGNYGIRLDNDVANANGFFTFTIRRSWITNGINGAKVGDSITISENTITGSRLTLPGILLSGLSGARQIVIRENNITTQAGGVALLNMEQPQLCFNQIEHPAYVGNYTGPYDSQVFLSGTVYATIKGNTIATGAAGCVAANYGLLLDNTSTYNIIEGNNIAKGELYNVGFGTSTVYNILKQDNSYETVFPTIYNTAVNNLGVIVPLTPQNSWVAYDIDTAITVKKSEDGTVLLSGALKNGTITSGTVLTNLPAGFRPNRQKRFQTTNFNGSAFSSATILIQTSGDVLVMAAAANNLLHLDGIIFPLE